MNSGTIYILVDKDQRTGKGTVREGVGYFTSQAVADTLARRLNEVEWQAHLKADRVFCEQWNRDMAARNAGGLLERIGWRKPRTGPVMEPQTLTLERFLDAYAMTVVTVHTIAPEEGQ